jgi:hypothetical protein
MKGVDICLSEGTKCGKGSQITVAAFDNTKTNSTSLNADPADSGTATLFRYHDSKYDGTAANPLESISQITVTVGGVLNTYNCTDGACRIYIGN